MVNLNSILVYSDLSPASANALRAAHALARATHASIEVIRVITEPLAADWTSELSTAGLPEVQEAMETEAQEWLERTLGEVGMAGVELTVEMGDPASEIARQAGEHRPDLVVIGAARGDEGRDATQIARDLLDAGAFSVLVVRMP